MSSIESSIIHFLALEEQVKVLAQDFIKHFTPSTQISSGYIREDLGSLQLKRLLKTGQSVSPYAISTLTSPI
nr:7933_t:CDS:2 [Entrophospora candida]